MDDRTNREFVRGIRQTYGLDVLGEGDRAVQFCHSNVVVVGKIIEVWMDDDALEASFLNVGIAPVPLSEKPHERGPRFGIRKPAESSYGIEEHSQQQIMCRVILDA